MVRTIDERIRSAVLEKIRPTEEEIQQQERSIEILRNALVERAESIGQEFTFIEAQGSTGPKQTQLHGAADIDLFVGLDPSRYNVTSMKKGAKRKEPLTKLFDGLVEDWFIPAAKRVNARNVMKAYSQHPFLSLVLNGLDVDIIACFDLTQEELTRYGPITAVDRTVHHTRFVTGHVDDTLRDDIRILKSFARASHAYGDTCAVGQMGFTGYAIELLVIFGNGLEGAIETLLRLKEKPLDPLNRPASDLRKIPNFRDDFVIIIDPTDTQRNVASSFSKRSVEWVFKRLRHMLSLDARTHADSIINMMIERPIPTDHLPKWLVPHSISKTLRTRKEAHYTLYRDKLYRLTRQIASSLRREIDGESKFGEVLWEIYFEEDVFAMGFMVEHPKIPRTYRRKGPPLKMTQAAKKFRQAHPDALERDGYLWAVVERKWTSARELVDHLVEKVTTEGFELTPDTGQVPARVLNTLYRYVMRLEEDFPLSKRQEYKDALRILEW